MCRNGNQEVSKSKTDVRIMESREVVDLESKVKEEVLNRRRIGLYMGLKGLDT